MNPMVALARRRGLPVVMIGVVLVMSACSSSPPPGSSSSTPSASESSPSAHGGLHLASPEFTDGGALPADSGRRTGNVSPALRWSDVPAGTRALTIICRDDDANGFVHWVVVNIPPRSTGVGSGQVPAGAVEGSNGFGTVGWGGPEPPSGVHNYRFTLYASPQPLDVAPGVDASSVDAMLVDHTTEQAELVGTFKAAG